jgi:hypothetical protein
MTTEPITAEEPKKTLNFGLDRGHTTAWGARAILKYRTNVDLLWDRQSCRGPRIKELGDILNSGPLREACNKGKDLHPREETGDVELFRGKGIVILGNTMASCGYLYMGAYLQRHRCTLEGS